jgi:hypothetical protein
MVAKLKAICILFQTTHVLNIPQVMFTPINRDMEAMSNSTEQTSMTGSPNLTQMMVVAIEDPSI